MTKGNYSPNEAKAALNKFKMEAASEVGISLKDGYNGDLTSRQAGSIGGQMVNNILPIRHSCFIRQNRTLKTHQHNIKYDVNILI